MSDLTKDREENIRKYKNGSWISPDRQIFILITDQEIRVMDHSSKLEFTGGVYREGYYVFGDYFVSDATRNTLRLHWFTILKGDFSRSEARVLMRQTQ